MTIATILPTGRTVFLDANANPLSLGKVYFYVPNTTTPKTTWQDATGSVQNSNPVDLDGNGSALIYGSGQYTQEVHDAAGNLVYTALTQDLYGLIVNGNNVFTGTNTFTGTCTFTLGFTLPNDSVTNAMLANMNANTVKVNNTASIAAPTDLAIAANRLLGRGSSGNISAISLGSGLTMSGTVLSASGFTMNNQKIIASGTYTPTARMAFCIVEVQAAGGSGANVASFNNLASGGGSGAYAKQLFSAATIGTSQSVTIGAFGASQGSLNSNGNVASATLFGALITCPGGLGGIAGGTTGTVAGSGITGTATGGDISTPGSSSAPAGSSSASGSTQTNGASSLYGAGGTAGGAAKGYGAGGGCGPTSGAGAAAVVYITEFCT